MEKVISQLSEKCQKCPRVSICNEKRKELCTYIERNDPCMASASATAGKCASADVLVKHDYRDIKISPTRTITIDLEDMKRQLKRDIYKALGGPCLEFGA